MQIAKVSKVLHSINNGTIGKYQGKDFDEIQLADKEAVQSETDSDSEGVDERGEEQSDTELESAKKDVEKNYRQGKRSVKKKPEASKARHHWTTEEKGVLLRQFKQSIARENRPGQLDCQNAIRKEPCLVKFEWKQIKFAVKNLITTHKRQSKKMV